MGFLPMSPETEAKINEIKLKHRSSLALEDWHKDRYFEKQGYVCDRILRGQDPTFRDTIERVNVDEVSMEEFLERYERGSKPVIITGVAERWPARREWQIEQLLQQYGTGRFKIGESDSGRKLRVTMSEFIEYMFGNKDDSPLYLFESSLEDHEIAKNMLKQYAPPKYFAKNYFGLLPEDEMPPHRWFLMGPKRSGTEIHQDPLGTSAWNSSVMGHKRWVLIPPSPDYDKKFVRGRHLI